MADEQATEQKGAAEQSQSEAEKKMALPDSVVANGGNAPVERGEYLKMVEANKDVVKRYGEVSFDSFMTKVGSDGAFAQQVVGDLLSGAEGKPAGVHPDSPQEYNLTGKIDRTVDTPTRIKFEGQAEHAPSAAV